MPEQNNIPNKRVDGLMTWVRLFLPVAIAAVGWYIGNTVGNFDSRMLRLEDRLGVQVLACATQHSTNNEKFNNIMQWIATDEARDIRLRGDIIRKEEYLRDKDRIEKELQKLELQIEK